MASQSVNVVPNMIQNEDFNEISQIVVVNNEMNSGFETDEVDIDAVLE